MQIGSVGSVNTASYPVGFSSADTRQVEKSMSTTGCQTCKNRKYVDGSNESVSFKSPTHISPEAAMGAVSAHEGEHVANAYSKAAKKGGEVVNASVAIHTAICPECGKTYVSGGTTTTSIRYNEDNPYGRNQKSLEGMNLIGGVIDLQV